MSVPRTTFVYIARHGQTVWNTEQRIQGSANSPLTDEGTAQATALARFARGLQIEQILSSPLGRARHTARIVAQAIERPIEICPELAEICAGECEGMRLPDVKTHLADFWQSRKQDKWHHRWPEGESYTDAVHRLGPLIGRETIWRTDGSTLIVGHQSLNRVLVYLLTDCTEQQVLQSAQPAPVIMRISSNRRVGHTNLQTVPALDQPIRWSAGLFPND